MQGGEEAAGPGTAPASALTEALRGGTLDGADTLFPPVEKEYQRVVAALKELE